MTPAAAPRPLPYRSDQLVVSLSHLLSVRAVLDEWGTTLKEAARDERLGLALLEGDFGRAAEHAAKTYPKVVQRVPAALADDPAGRDLEVTVGGLRAAFKDKWNWLPTLGKNRVLSDVSGQWDVGIGGDTSALWDVGIGGDTSAQWDVGIGDDSNAQWDVGIGGDSNAQWDVGIGGGPSARWDVGIGGEPQAVDGPAAGFGPRSGDEGARATVAIVDTGVLPHPWLAGSYLGAPDAVLTGPDIELALHHGTFVAGLVLKQAPAAQLWIERQLDTDGHRESWDLAVALARLADRGVDIVNLSLGCQTDDDEEPLVLQRAIAALGPSTLVVAAAGNVRLPAGVRPRPMWPAATESVVAVGSTDALGEDSPFSPDAPWMDARAVGERVVSTFGVSPGPAPAFTRWNGTSFAAPTVSGAVAAAMRPGETAPQTWRRLAPPDGPTFRVGH